MASKKSSWSKTFGRSVFFSAIDVASEVMPETTRILTGKNADFVKGIYDTITQLRRGQTSLMKLARKGFGDDVVDAVRDVGVGAKENWDHFKKTGSPTLPESDEEDFGFDMDFGEDNLGFSDGDFKMDDLPDPNSLTANVNKNTTPLEMATMETGSAEITAINDQTKAMVAMGEHNAQSIAKVGKITADQTSILGGILTQGNQLQAKTAMSTAALENALHAKTMVGLEKINDNLTAIVTFNNDSLAKYTMGAMKYFDDSLAVLNKISETLLRAYPEKKKSDPFQSNLDKAGMAGGGFDLEGYLGVVKKNFFYNTTLGMLAETFFDPDMMRMMWANPLQTGLEMFIENMIPKLLKSTMKEFDKTVANFFPTMAHRLYEMGNNSQNPILQFLGTVFGIAPNSGSRNLRAYEKGPVPFDGITHKTINHVIPTQLSEIIHLLGGGERQMYNYENARFETVSQMKESLKHEKDSDAQNAMGYELKDEMEKFLGFFKSQDKKRDAEIKKNIEAGFLELMESGTFLNPRKLDISRSKTFMEDNTAALIAKAFGKYIAKNPYLESQFGAATQNFANAQAHRNNQKLRPGDNRHDVVGDNFGKKVEYRGEYEKSKEEKDIERKLNELKSGVFSQIKNQKEIMKLQHELDALKRKREAGIHTEVTALEGKDYAEKISSTGEKSVNLLFDINEELKTFHKDFLNRIGKVGNISGSTISPISSSGGGSSIPATDANIFNTDRKVLDSLNISKRDWKKVKSIFSNLDKHTDQDKEWARDIYARVANKSQQEDEYSQISQMAKIYDKEKRKEARLKEAERVKNAHGLNKQEREWQAKAREIIKNKDQYSADDPMLYWAKGMKKDLNAKKAQYKADQANQAKETWKEENPNLQHKEDFKRELKENNYIDTARVDKIVDKNAMGAMSEGAVDQVVSLVDRKVRKDIRKAEKEVKKAEKEKEKLKEEGDDFFENLLTAIRSPMKTLSIGLQGMQKTLVDMMFGTNGKESVLKTITDNIHSTFKTMWTTLKDEFADPLKKFLFEDLSKYKNSNAYKWASGMIDKMRGIYHEDFNDSEPSEKAQKRRAEKDAKEVAKEEAKDRAKAGAKKTYDEARKKLEDLAGIIREPHHAAGDPDTETVWISEGEYIVNDKKGTRRKVLKTGRYDLKKGEERVIAADTSEAAIKQRQANEDIAKVLGQSANNTLESGAKVLEAKLSEVVEVINAGNEISSETAKNTKEMAEKEEKKDGPKEADKKEGNSISNHVSDILSDIKDNISKHLFGDHKDEKTGKQKSFKEQVGDMFATGIRNFSNYFLGTNYDTDVAISSYKKELKQSLPRGAAKGLVYGAGLGLLAAAGPFGGFGLLGSLFLPGGIVGAGVLGLAAGIASESEGLKKWLFGEKDDKGERQGGKVPKKVLDWISKNKTTILGGTAVGLFSGITGLGPVSLLLGLLPGSGMLGSMAVGVVGPVTLSLAAAFALKSKTFQEKMFGKDDGKGNKVGGMMQSNFVTELQKRLPNIAVGAGIGGVGMLALGQFGLLGGLALSPFLGAVAGGAMGFMQSSKAFRQAMFGEQDETGKFVKGGLVDRIQNLFTAEVINPLANLVDIEANKMKNFAIDKIMIPLSDAMLPFKMFINNLMESTKKTVGSVLDKITGQIKTVFSPLINAITSLIGFITRGVRDTASSMIQSMTDIATKVLSFPVKLISTPAEMLRDHYRENGTDDQKALIAKSDKERAKRDRNRRLEREQDRFELDQDVMIRKIETEKLRSIGYRATGEQLDAKTDEFRRIEAENKAREEAKKIAERELQIEEEQKDLLNLIYRAIVNGQTNSLEELREGAKFTEEQEIALAGMDKLMASGKIKKGSDLERKLNEKRARIWSSALVAKDQEEVENTTLSDEYKKQLQEIDAQINSDEVKKDRKRRKELEAQRKRISIKGQLDAEKRESKAAHDDFDSALKDDETIKYIQDSFKNTQEFKRMQRIFAIEDKYQKEGKLDNEKQNRINSIRSRLFDKGAIRVAENIRNDTSQNKLTSVADRLFATSGDEGKAFAVGKIKSSMWDTNADVKNRSMEDLTAQNEMARREEESWREKLYNVLNKNLGVSKATIAKADDWFKSLKDLLIGLLGASGILGILGLIKDLLGKLLGDGSDNSTYHDDRALRDAAHIIQRKAARAAAQKAAKTAGRDAAQAVVKTRRQKIYEWLFGNEAEGRKNVIGRTADKLENWKKAAVAYKDKAVDKIGKGTKWLGAHLPGAELYKDVMSGFIYGPDDITKHPVTGQAGHWRWMKGPDGKYAYKDISQLKDVIKDKSWRRAEFDRREGVTGIIGSKVSNKYGELKEWIKNTRLSKGIEDVKNKLTDARAVGKSRINRAKDFLSETKNGIKEGLLGIGDTIWKGDYYGQLGGDKKYRVNRNGAFINAEADSLLRKKWGEHGGLKGIVTEEIPSKLSDAKKGLEKKIGKFVDMAAKALEKVGSGIVAEAKNIDKYAVEFVNQLAKAHGIELASIDLKAGYEMMAQKARKIPLGDGVTVGAIVDESKELYQFTKSGIVEAKNAVVDVGSKTIDKIANSDFGKKALGAVKKTGEGLYDFFMKNVKGALDGLAKNETVQKYLGGDGLSKLVGKIKDKLTGLTSAVFKNIAPKVLKAVGGAAAKTVVNIATFGSGQLLFSMYDAYSGASDAAEMWQVNPEDVTEDMRLACVVLNIIMGLGPMVWVDLALEAIYLGSQFVNPENVIDIKRVLLSMVYECMSDEYDEKAIEELQNKQKKEYEEYVEKQYDEAYSAYAKEAEEKGETALSKEDWRKNEKLGGKVKVKNREAFAHEKAKDDHFLLDKFREYKIGRFLTGYNDENGNYQAGAFSMIHDFLFDSDDLDENGEPKRKGIFTKIGDAITTFGDTVSSFIDGAVELFDDTKKFIFDMDMDERLTTVWKFLVGGKNENDEYELGIFPKMWGAITEFGGKVVNVFSNAWNKTAADSKDDWTPFGHAIDTLSYIVKSFLGWEDNGDKRGVIFQSISKLMNTDIFKAIIPFGEEIANEFDYATNLIANEGAMSLLSEILKGIFGWSSEKGKTIVDIASEKFSNAFDSAMSTVSSFTDRISKAIEEAFGNFTSGMKEGTIFTGLSWMLKGLFGYKPEDSWIKVVKDAISGLANKVAGAFSYVGNKFKEFGDWFHNFNLIDTLKNALFGLLKENFPTLYNSIMDTKKFDENNKSEAARNAFNDLKGDNDKKGGQGKVPYLTKHKKRLGGGFLQTDPRWANKPLVQGNASYGTMKDVGCGPTALATAINNTQKRGGGFIDPAELASQTVNDNVVADYDLTGTRGVTEDYFDQMDNVVRIDPFDNNQVKTLADSDRELVVSNGAHYQEASPIPGQYSQDPSQKLYNINDPIYGNYTSTLAEMQKNSQRDDGPNVMAAVLPLGGSGPANKIQRRSRLGGGAGEEENKNKDTKDTKENKDKPTTGASADKLLSSARTMLGWSYNMTSNPPKGSTDCSHLVMQSMKLAGIENYNYRTARDQYDFFKSKNALFRPEDAKPGDVLFMADTYGNFPKGTATHMGIYTGDGKMIHASSSQGVVEVPIGNWHKEHMLAAGSIKVALGIPNIKESGSGRVASTYSGKLTNASTVKDDESVDNATNKKESEISKAATKGKISLQEFSSRLAFLANDFVSQIFGSGKYTSTDWSQYGKSNTNKSENGSSDDKSSSGDAKVADDMSQEEFWKWFKSKGYSDEVTAGIMGNMAAENGFKPKYSRFQQVSGHEVGGLGLFQWTYDTGRGYEYPDPFGKDKETVLSKYPTSRMVKYIKWVDDNKKGKYESSGNQLEYMYEQDLKDQQSFAKLSRTTGGTPRASKSINSWYPNDYNTIQGLEDTTIKWSADFERGSWSLHGGKSPRLSEAEKIYNKYHGSSTSSDDKKGGSGYIELSNLIRRKPDNIISMGEYKNSVTSGEGRMSEGRSVPLKKEYDIYKQRINDAKEDSVKDTEYLSNLMDKSYVNREAEQFDMQNIIANRAENAKLGGGAASTTAETDPHKKEEDQKLDPDSFKGLPLYRQYDTRWGSHTYDTDSIAKRGCGPTGMSMIATWATGKDDITPDKASDWSVKHGHSVPGAGTSHAFPDAYAKDLGFSMQEKRATQENIDEGLKKGPLLNNQGPGHFTGVGHYIVIAGKRSDGTYVIHDPNSNKNNVTPRTKISASTLTAAADKIWVPEGAKGSLEKSGGADASSDNKSSSNSNTTTVSTNTSGGLLETIASIGSSLNVITSGLLGKTLGIRLDTTTVSSDSSSDNKENKSESEEKTPSNEDMPKIDGPGHGISDMKRSNFTFNEELKKRKATDAISIHHSSGNGNETAASIHEDHRQRKDSVTGELWAGIGYNLVIIKNGQTEEGRPIDMQGAHTNGSLNNCHVFGICVPGNWNNTLPSEAQMQSLAKSVAEVCVKYNIPCDRQHVTGHREWDDDGYHGPTYKSNDCPGHMLYAKLDEVVANAKKLIDDYNAKKKGGSGKNEKLNKLKKLLGDTKSARKELTSITDKSFKNVDANKPFTVPKLGGSGFGDSYKSYYTLNELTARDDNKDQIDKFNERIRAFNETANNRLDSIDTDVNDGNWRKLYPNAQSISHARMTRLQSVLKQNSDEYNALQKEIDDYYAEYNNAIKSSSVTKPTELPVVTEEITKPEPEIKEEIKSIPAESLVADIGIKPRVAVITDKLKPINVPKPVYSSGDRFSPSEISKMYNIQYDGLLNVKMPNFKVPSEILITGNEKDNTEVYRKQRWQLELYHKYAKEGLFSNVEARDYSNLGYGKGQNKPKTVEEVIEYWHKKHEGHTIAETRWDMNRENWNTLSKDTKVGDVTQAFASTFKGGEYFNDPSKVHPVVRNFVMYKRGHLKDIYKAIGFNGLPDKATKLNWQMQQMMGYREYAITRNIAHFEIDVFRWQDRGMLPVDVWACANGYGNLIPDPEVLKRFNAEGEANKALQNKSEEPKPEPTVVKPEPTVVKPEPKPEPTSLVTVTGGNEKRRSTIEALKRQLALWKPLTEADWKASGSQVPYSLAKKRNEQAKLTLENKLKELEAQEALEAKGGSGKSSKNKPKLGGGSFLGIKWGSRPDEWFNRDAREWRDLAEEYDDDSYRKRKKKYKAIRQGNGDYITPAEISKMYNIQYDRYMNVMMPGFGYPENMRIVAGDSDEKIYRKQRWQLELYHKLRFHNKLPNVLTNVSLPEEKPELPEDDSGGIFSKPEDELKSTADEAYEEITPDRTLSGDQPAKLTAKYDLKFDKFLNLKMPGFIVPDEMKITEKDSGAEIYKKQAMQIDLFDKTARTNTVFGSTKNGPNEFFGNRQIKDENLNYVDRMDPSSKDEQLIADKIKLLNLKFSLNGDLLMEGLALPKNLKLTDADRKDKKKYNTKILQQIAEYEKFKAKRDDEMKKVRQVKALINSDDVSVGGITDRYDVQFDEFTNVKMPGFEVPKDLIINAKDDDATRYKKQYKQLLLYDEQQKKAKAEFADTSPEAVSKRWDVKFDELGNVNMPGFKPLEKYIIVPNDKDPNVIWQKKAYQLKEYDKFRKAQEKANGNAKGPKTGKIENSVETFFGQAQSTSGTVVEKSEEEKQLEAKIRQHNLSFDFEGNLMMPGWKVPNDLKVTDEERKNKEMFIAKQNKQITEYLNAKIEEKNEANREAIGKDEMALQRYVRPSESDANKAEKKARELKKETYDTQRKNRFGIKFDDLGNVVIDGLEIPEQLKITADEKNDRDLFINKQLKQIEVYLKDKKHIKPRKNFLQKAVDSAFEFFLGDPDKGKPKNVDLESLSSHDLTEIYDVKFDEFGNIMMSDYTVPNELRISKEEVEKADKENDREALEDKQRAQLLAYAKMKDAGLLKDLKTYGVDLTKPPYPKKNFLQKGIESMTDFFYGKGELTSTKIEKSDEEKELERKIKQNKISLDSMGNVQMFGFTVPSLLRISSDERANAVIYNNKMIKQVELFTSKKADQLRELALKRQAKKEHFQEIEQENERQAREKETSEANQIELKNAHYSTQRANKYGLLFDEYGNVKIPGFSVPNELMISEKEKKLRDQYFVKKSQQIDLYIKHKNDQKRLEDERNARKRKSRVGLIDKITGKKEGELDKYEYLSPAEISEKYNIQYDALNNVMMPGFTIPDDLKIDEFDSKEEMFRKQRKQLEMYHDLERAKKIDKRAELGVDINDLNPHPGAVNKLGDIFGGIFGFNKMPNFKVEKSREELMIDQKVKKYKIKFDELGNVKMEGFVIPDELKITQDEKNNSDIFNTKMEKQVGLYSEKAKEAFKKKKEEEKKRREEAKAAAKKRSEERRANDKKLKEEASKQAKEKRLEAIIDKKTRYYQLKYDEFGNLAMPGFTLPNELRITEREKKDRDEYLRKKMLQIDAYIKWYEENKKKKKDKPDAANDVEIPPTTGKPELPKPPGKPPEEPGNANDVEIPPTGEPKPETQLPPPKPPELPQPPAKPPELPQPPAKPPTLPPVENKPEPKVQFTDEEINAGLNEKYETIAAKTGIGGFILSRQGVGQNPDVSIIDSDIKLIKGQTGVLAVPVVKNILGNLDYYVATKPELVATVAKTLLSNYNNSGVEFRPLEVPGNSKFNSKTTVLLANKKIINYDGVNRIGNVGGGLNPLNLAKNTLSNSVVQPGGVTPEYFGGAAAQLGYTMNEGDPFSDKDVDTLLKSGKEGVAGGQINGANHYVSFRGGAGNSVYINDPARGSKEMTKNSFKSFIRSKNAPNYIGTVGGGVSDKDYKKLQARLNEIREKNKSVITGGASNELSVADSSIGDRYVVNTMSTESNDLLQAIKSLDIKNEIIQMLGYLKVGVENLAEIKNKLVGGGSITNNIAYTQRTGGAGTTLPQPPEDKTPDYLPGKPKNASGAGRTGSISSNMQKGLESAYRIARAEGY